jgi:transposase
MEHRITVPAAGSEDRILFAALELSLKGWVVAVRSSGEMRESMHRVPGGDWQGLIGLLRRLAAERGCARVASCYEAGRDGFWLHRRLLQAGVETIVIDAASVPVERRARRRKTDRLDARALLRVLASWRAGEREACSVVRVPSPAEEDARDASRERGHLAAERQRTRNRIVAALARQGVYVGCPEADELDSLRTPSGERLPPGLLGALRRDLERLQQVSAQLRAVEAVRDRRAAQPPADDLLAGKIAALTRLKAVGPEIATVLVSEVYWRPFTGRKKVAGYCGLGGSPWQSGDMKRDQGIAKSGNRRARALLIELAWLWLRWQPQSALAQAWRDQVGGAGGRIRKIAIVALARKLAIALWRYLETGLVPAGALLKA